MANEEAKAADYANVIMGLGHQLTHERARKVLEAAIREAKTDAFEWASTVTCPNCAAGAALEFHSQPIRTDNWTGGPTEVSGWLHKKEGEAKGRVYHERCEASAIRALKDSLCPHNWIDATNEVITSGEYCSECGAMRPAPTYADAFVLDLSGEGYWMARYHKELWPIGYDKPIALEVIAKLNGAHRPNLELRGSELWVCWNNHDKGDKCDYELLVERAIDLAPGFQPTAFASQAEPH